MEYIAKIYAGSSDADLVLVTTFDTADFPHTSSRCNAYDTSHKFAIDQLDQSDFVKIHFDLKEPNEENESWVKDIWMGAFTHPIRGRCKFVGTENSFEALKRRTLKDAETPIYSANQLYAMRPLEVATEDIIHDFLEHGFKEAFNLEYLIYTDEIKEFENKVEAEKRIEVRYLARVSIGYCELWLLATIWYQGTPLAVITRYGEDDYETYVSNPNALHEMMGWVCSLAPKPPVPGIIDGDTPIEALTEFGNHTLHEFYDVASGLPQRSPENAL